MHKIKTLLIYWFLSSPWLICHQSVQSQVVDLPFTSFYKFPVRSNGLEISDTLQNAHGQSRRIIGFMVQQEKPSLGRFMMSPRPVVMNEHADGEADDLPAALVTVYLDTYQKKLDCPTQPGADQFNWKNRGRASRRN